MDFKELESGFNLFGHEIEFDIVDARYSCSLYKEDTSIRKDERLLLNLKTTTTNIKEIFEEAFLTIMLADAIRGDKFNKDALGLIKYRDYEEATNVFIYIFLDPANFNNILINGLGQNTNKGYVNISTEKNILKWDKESNFMITEFYLSNKIFISKN